MLTLLTLALWMAGLAAALAGHLVIGSCIAGAGIWFAPKALARRDDMETAFGLAVMFAGGVWVIRLVAAALP